MTRAVLLLALLLVLAPPALACDPAVILHGTYAFPHEGVKPDGQPFTAFVLLEFHAWGTVSIGGLFSIGGRAPIQANATPAYAWSGPCTLVIDHLVQVLVEPDGARLYVLSWSEGVVGVAFRMGE